MISFIAIIIVMIIGGLISALIVLGFFYYRNRNKNAPNAANDQIEVKIISPTQVIPGTVMKIRVSFSNTQDISSFQVQSMNVTEKTKNIKNNIKQEKKKVTINAISYENPFQLTDKITTYKQGTTPKSKDLKNKEYSVSKPKQEKKLVNKELTPTGNALKLKDELRNEFYIKIQTEKFSDEQIKSYVDLENELKNIIKDGRDGIVIEVPVPEEFPEGKTLTIPLNIEYSTDSSSMQTFSEVATVTVTSNPVPRRAIIINIDGAKRDALYNSLADMPNMLTIVNDGVKFTDAKTVFPSITLAAQASIFTGNYPGKHKIAGNIWFERNSQTYRKYWMDIWYDMWNDGQANEDLNPTVDTIYEAAKNDKNMDSTVIFNHYSRLNSGTTKWIKPGIIEALYQGIHEYDNIDSNAIHYALEELEFENTPDIMTIYFSGIDSYSHLYGPSGEDTHNQEYYLANYVDKEIGRLLNGYCYLDTPLGCAEYYDGLIGLGLKDETIIVILSDHGQTSVVDDDTHAISRDELEAILEKSGYDIYDNGPFEGRYNAVAAPNGGMAQIYIADTVTKDWNAEIDLCDLKSALDAFKSESYVDVVLFRCLETSSYCVYTGSGNIQDLQSFFVSKPNYVDAVNRIKGLDSERSGDIILLAKDEWYFADKIMKGEHGGLSPDESYIPLIFSGPTIRKGETDSTPARSIDMANTLADLLGFSMPNNDGIILPVQDYFGYRVQDSNTQDGPSVKR